MIESEVINTLKEQEEDLRLLTYKIILEKFNKKYKNLNDNQINLLKEFLNNGSDRHYLLSLTKEQSKNLVHSLERKIKSVKNEVHVIKITEVINQLRNFETLTNVKNNYLTALMIGYELDGQLNNFQQND